MRTVHSQAAQKWQSWRGGTGRGVGAPRCSGKLWILCCDREQMGEKKIYTSVGKAATQPGVNTRAPGCKSILDPLPRPRCTRIQMCKHTCTCMHMHVHIHTNTHRPQFDSKYCPISASAPFFLRSPSTSPHPHSGSTYWWRNRPRCWLGLRSLDPKQGRNPSGGGAQFKAWPLRPFSQPPGPSGPPSQHHPPGLFISEGLPFSHTPPVGHGP